MTDQLIIAKCKQGQEKAYAQFYKDCAPYVYSLVKRYIADVDFRKDIMQETFAKIFLNIKSFDANKGNINGWVRKITVNECLQNIRKNRPLFVAEGLENSKEIKDDSPLPTDLKRTDIEKILGKMPTGYKLVFMLFVMDGFSHEEISLKLNITQQTSRSQLSRSKKWIQRYLATQYKSGMYGLL